ncbi:MAG: HutD family protein [Ilumatobacteraceae bacterium]
MHIVRAIDATVMPWRNGGGTTREYLTHPGSDGFDWRLSVADVSQDGPFSAFPGFDRILVLLSGAGMTLHGPSGSTATLHRPLDHHRFAGEVAIDASLVDGPTTDLNLFWRRDLWQAEVHVLHTPVDVPTGSPSLTYVTDGTVAVGNTALGPGDVLVSDEPTRLEGDATIVAFVLQPANVDGA